MRTVTRRQGTVLADSVLDGIPEELHPYLLRLAKARAEALEALHDLNRAAVLCPGWHMYELENRARQLLG